jgi:hypothetical protein
LPYGILSFLLFASCITSKVDSSPEVKILSAISQKYRGGVKGSSSGIKYKILIIAPANQNEFKSNGFWIENEYAVAQAFRDKLGVNRLKFNKGDTLVVSANFTFTPKGYIFQDTSVIKTRPKGFNHKLLVEYEIKGKKKYAGINQINELEEQLRP